jgi:hypothetical protein
MKRSEFEHAIRAAGAVLGVGELLVIGSQALHASIASDLPPEASRSVEVDVAAMSGDADGRAADLIDGSIGEDIEFCRALVERRLVDAARLRDGLARVEVLDDRVRAAVAARIPE